MSGTVVSSAASGEQRPLTGPQSAALAKLAYAIAESHPLTLLCGPAGVGKTTVLGRLAEDARARGHTVQQVSWSGMWNERPEQAAKCGPVPGTGMRTAQVKNASVNTVVLVDDAHRAVGRELAECVERWRCDRDGIAIVLAGEGRLLSLVAGDTRLEQSVRLRAALPPFTLTETSRLLVSSVPAAADGAHAEEVIRTIHEITGGAPGVALRLAEMVAMLAAAEPRRPITGDDVETIHRRLSPNAA